jgi:heme/copper-type cytochrome/quinol oxidase subunit 3
MKPALLTGSAGALGTTPEVGPGVSAMQTVIVTLLPVVAAFVPFAAFIFGRRWLSGEPLVQTADKPKIKLVFSHVLPLLAACTLYNAVVHMRADIRLEVAALLLVVLALGLSVYRYLEAVDEPVKR